MTSKFRTTWGLGLVCLIFALVLAVIWVPLDADTGLIEKVRRRVAIGDGLAPTVAAVFIGLGGLLLMLAPGRNGAERITTGNLRFLGVLLLGLIVVTGLMRWAGPLAVSLLGEGDYRLLRDTAPWKWVGFALGGFALVAGLIIWIEGRVNGRAFWVAAAAVLVLIALFDLPFDDLLLPPNGDV